MHRISLDRDSRGYTSNASVNPDGTPMISPNQEVIAIRAKLPGDFLTAVNYYQRNTDPDLAVDCKVELIKLNPTVQVVQSVKLHFDRQNQTLNAIAFHVDEDGTVKVLPLPAEDLISSISSPLPQ
jgi:hypothetical protein